MFKSTLFIAVQCSQCSTMQVKQQKKSSNKWNCVVCNLKQSVRKIYAQGFQAKDVRKFVQGFNMSRNFDKQYNNNQQLFALDEIDKVGTAENKSNRRTDWSEYVDDQSDGFESSYLKSKFNENEMGAEPKIVTEFTEDLMLKKPKMKGKFGSSFRSADKESCKPNLSKRVSTEEAIESRGKSSDRRTFWDEDVVNNDELIRNVRRKCEQQQQEKVSTVMKTSASKWSHFMDNNDVSRNVRRQCEREQQGPNKLKAVTKPGASKWNKYITDEDIYRNGNSGEGMMQMPAFSDNLSLIRGYNELEGIEQPVEEDIHPDFM